MSVTLSICGQRPALVSINWIKREGLYLPQLEVASSASGPVAPPTIEGPTLYIEGTSQPVSKGLK